MNKEENNKVENIETEKVIVKRNKGTINKTVEFNLLEVIIIILITGILVSVVSSLIVFNNYDKLTNNPQSSNPTYLNDDLKEFKDTYNHIINSYVEDVDKEGLIDAAIEGMYNYLGDEYSIYMDQETTTDLQEQLSGEYTGLGIEIATYITKDGYKNVINKVFENSAAEKAGLKEGDVLLKLDEHDLTKSDSAFISSTVKYGTKEEFTITYSRDEKENTVTIKRGYVFINSVNSKEDNEIGIITIDTFSATIPYQVRDAVNGFSDKVTSVIIDLRDNTGGYLSSAYNTADLFIEKGKVVYQLKDKNNNISKYEAKTDVLRRFDKIVVLINENSASASEILAIALKESANATIVGETSYGKGTVQETEQLSSGSMVKYTSSYWLSPNGNSINKLGIKPDVEVKDSNKQLDKAKETIRK
jgi:carboxyl-terminal processing protease